MNSFNGILVHYSGKGLKMSSEFIDFSDLFFREGSYEKCFDEIETIGEGSYGSVFKVLTKGNTNEWAIKKLSSK